MPPRVRPGEIKALTGLRAVAALAVLLHHFAVVLEDLFPQASFDAVRRGYLGVDVFFVLSGFILSYNYAGRIRTVRDHCRFIGYRLARIYPLHLAMLVAVTTGVHGALAADLTIHSPEKYTLDAHLLLHLTLTHAWGFEEGLRYNLPSWSISAEFFAYLLFPLAWAASARWGHRMALLLAFAGSLATVLGLRALGHPDLHVPHEHALVRVSGEFLAGCLAYRAFSQRPHSPGASRTGGSLVLAGLAVLTVSPWADPGMAFGAIVLVYVLASGTGPLVRAFALAPVVWLGRISYAIYMTHLPTLSTLQRLVPPDGFQASETTMRLGVVGLYLAIVLVVATTAYYTIERPGRRWLRDAVRDRLASGAGSDGRRAS